MIAFVVEEAGCASCAALVREALEPLAEVRSIEVDETADEVAVELADAELSEQDVDAALAAVSAGAGHAYRVRAGSWCSG